MSIESAIEEMFRRVLREEIRAALEPHATAALEKPATYEEAAAFAGCSKSTIQGWVKSKALPATGLGKLRRVLLSDVKKVLAGMSPRPAPVSKAKARAQEILRGLTERGGR